MTESYFMLRSKMKQAQIDNILGSHYIVLDGYTYLQLSKAPSYRRPSRKLQRGDERILIYS
jgi:hypothetical protein